LSSISTITGDRARGQTCLARMFGASLASSSGVRSLHGSLRCAAWLNESRTSASPGAR